MRESIDRRQTRTNWPDHANGTPYGSNQSVPASDKERLLAVQSIFPHVELDHIAKLIQTSLEPGRQCVSESIATNYINSVITKYLADHNRIPSYYMMKTALRSKFGRKAADEYKHVVSLVWTLQTPPHRFLFTSLFFCCISQPVTYYRIPVPTIA